MIKYWMVCLANIFSIGMCILVMFANLLAKNWFFVGMFFMIGVGATTDWIKTHRYMRSLK